MPSLKDLKNRIASVKATQKITKAMKMVAAAKLRRAQEAAEAARPYAERMNRVLAGLSAGNAEAPLLLAGTGKDQVHLLIVATGERGLAGGFNSSIIRLARDHAQKLLAQGKTVKILTVGRKGNEVLRRSFKENIVHYVTFREVKQLGFVQADEVAHKVLELFNAGEFDVATLFFARFQSVISQVATAQQIIPAKFGGDQSAEPTAASSALYEYEPSEQEILEDLLPRNVAVQIFRALLENNASFYGAQMSAMDNATRNAGDMINKLTLSYNRQRQAQITKELIEIISGAEAL